MIMQLAAQVLFFSTAFLFFSFSLLLFLTKKEKKHHPLTFCQLEKNFVLNKNKIKNKNIADRFKQPEALFVFCFSFFFSSIML